MSTTDRYEKALGVGKMKKELAAKKALLEAKIKEVEAMKRRLGALIASEKTRIAIKYEPLGKEWDMIQQSRDELAPKSLTKGENVTWGELWKRTANEVAAGRKNLTASQTSVLLFYLKHLYGEGKVAQEKKEAAKAGAPRNVAMIVDHLPEQPDPKGQNERPTIDAEVIDARTILTDGSGTNEGSDPLWEAANAPAESGIPPAGE